MEDEAEQDREAKRRSRLRQIGRLAAVAAVMALIYGVLLGWWWYLAIVLAYIPIATVARGQMTRWFGPKWEQVPPDVSVIGHLRELRRRRS